MAEHVALHEKLAESVRKFPVLYDKSSNDFKDKHKKERAWGDMAKEVCFATGKSLLNHFLCYRLKYSCSCSFIMYHFMLAQP